VGDDLEIKEDGGDSALQNLIGDDADRTARAWADSGRGAEKLAVVEQYLTGPARDAARRALGLAPLPRESNNNNNNNNGVERTVSILQRIRDKQRIQVCRRGAQSSVGESDQETESQDSDAHARTAKMLFGLGAGTTQIVESQHEKESREEGTGTVPASRVPTPPLSECGSRHSVARGSSRHVTHADLSPPQGRRLLRTGDARAMRFTDFVPGPSPPSRLIAHASSPSSLTSPIRSRSPARRGDTPLVGLKNTPLSRTKRQHPWSQSQSQSQSPPPTHSNVPKPDSKRRKLERLSTVPAHEDAPTSPRKQVLSMAGTENITPADLNVNPTILDADAENRKAHRRVLLARSRVIEEKLRRALLAPSSTPPEKVP
jgi:hypothetical protein